LGTDDRVCGAGSEQAVDPVYVAAGHVEGRVVLADRVLVRTLEQAVNLAVGVVVELDLGHAELVRDPILVPCAICSTASAGSFRSS
jgi:hypothetical protein